MSNRHVSELRKVYEHIFADATYAFPTLRMEFERDLTHLQALVERRGVSVYLEILPSIGKHFDRCLANGQYCRSGIPLTKRVSGRVLVPAFLRGLYLLIFDESGRLKDDANLEAVFFLRQIVFAAKKASFPCTAEKIATEVDEFYAVDQTLPEPHRFWERETEAHASEQETFHGFEKSPIYRARADALFPGSRKELSIVLGTLDKVSSILTASLGSYDPSDWRFKHGPGAVAEYTGVANKYSWRSWSSTLETEFPYADYAFHSYSAWAKRHDDHPELSSEEQSSRLIGVPKSFSKPRLIAAEPSSNQWCQQNLWHYFSERSGACWVGEFVHFRDQTTNGQLAKDASVDGRLATVDLSAASDRVSTHFVESLFRTNVRLLRALRATRTRSVGQSLSARAPEIIRLRKFSTMGSACTFPVESLGFLAVAVSCALVKRGLKATVRNIQALRGDIAVFGDDLVIPSDSRELLVSTLEVLHFKVNMAKSFWNGNFRESCGVEAFRGVDVTPAYWHGWYDGKPASEASVVATANNFYQKFMLSTSTYLASTLPRLIPDVAYRSGAFGYKTRTDPDNRTFRRRWNWELQREEICVRTRIESNSKSPTNDDTAFLQLFTECPGPGIPWTHGVAQRPRLQVKTRWVSQDSLISQ
jgi:hypothetical protein